MIQCPVPPVPSDGVLALHSGHVGWALGVSLSLMALLTLHPHRSGMRLQAPTMEVHHLLNRSPFKQGSRKSHQAVGKATTMFLPQAETGTWPSPTAVPVRAWNLPGVPRTFQRSRFGSFGCHGLCWGLVLTEMRMLREQSPQGWAGSHCWWSHPQPPPAAPSLHTQTPVQVSCAGKCRGVCPSGGFSARTGAGSEDETGESGAEGVHQVSI